MFCYQFFLKRIRKDQQPNESGYSVNANIFLIYKVFAVRLFEIIFSIKFPLVLRLLAKSVVSILRYFSCKN